MNDMRRTLLWSVLAFSLLMLWDGWLRHTGKPSMFAPAPAVVSSASPPASGASAALSGLAGASSVPGASATAPASALPGAAPAAVVPRERLVLSTDLLRVSIDPVGGNVSKVELLAHQSDEGADHRIVVVDEAGHSYLAQSGLVSASGVALPNHTTAMKVLTEARTLADGQDTLEFKLESEVVGGMQRRLTYTFQRGSYVIGVRQEMVNRSPAPVRADAYVQLVRDGQVPQSAGFFAAPTAYTGPVVYTEEAKFQKVEFKHIEDGKAEFTKKANDGWVSVVQHYFAASWLDAGQAPREFFARKLSTNLYAVGMLFPLGEVAPGQTATLNNRLFVGPIEEKKLAEIAPGLELLKDYGVVTILAKPLFWLLHAIHNLVGNWGWSIVLLVVLLKAAFFGLNAKAYKSMAKMKAINPRITEMRERLKDNPQQAQQEMLKIYKEEKVNPIGGCLPIMVQIPVFIALYWVLLSSVEIRNAPWAWIVDLSVKDPYFVLPALMLVSTLVQTWLNPTPPDPVQAKMMWIMPLMFSVMFFFFPAGLVLYWFTNNVLSIAQQWAINRQIEAGAK